jgi:branched-chain amino acid transport system permease protein
MAVVALVVTTVAFGLFNRGGSVPAALFAVGLVGGATVALQAAGIVLVYRSSRIINFAQIQMGTFAGLLFVELVTNRTLVRAVAAVCPVCVPEPRTVGDLAGFAGTNTDLGRLVVESGVAKIRLDDPSIQGVLPTDFSVHELAIAQAPGWLVQISYWVSLLLAITAATVLVGAVYLIVRKFNQAPKLVLTVITIGLGFFVQQAGGWILHEVFGTLGSQGGDRSARLPIHGSFTWEPAVFSAADVVTVVVAVLASAALLLFLRRSRVGIVIRGAAENPDRAETLGVNVGAVTARAWLIAGALSGLAAILAVARSGAPPSAGGYDVFVRTLAAAIAGGLVQLPLALLAAFVIGAAEQVFAWVFGSQSVLSLILLLIIVALLLVQRTRASRAEREASASWQASRELRGIPRELRAVGTVRTTIRALATCAALVVVGFPWFMSPSQIVLADATIVYAMVGLSLLVLTGWAGQISLGQMAFAAFGAWSAGRLGWPLPLALVVGGVGGMLLAVVVGLPSLKLRGLHLAVTTLALGVAAPAVLFDPDLLGTASVRQLHRPVLLGINFEDERAFYYLSTVLVLGMIGATVGMRRSSVARTLIAAKDNEQAAMSFGISLLRARLVAFAVSGFMAAVAGVLLAYAQHGVDPVAYGPDTGVSVFLLTLLGGLGSIAGPVIGALYLGGLRILAGTPLGQITNIMLNPGLGVIILLWVMPGGIVQGVFAVRDAWLRRVADRHRIHVPSLVADRGGIDGPIPMQPKVRASGGEMFIPERFRLTDQWLISARRAARETVRSRG